MPSGPLATRLLPWDRKVLNDQIQTRTGRMVSGNMTMMGMSSVAPTILLPDYPVAVTLRNSIKTPTMQQGGQAGRAAT